MSLWAPLPPKFPITPFHPDCGAGQDQGVQQWEGEDLTGVIRAHTGAAFSQAGPVTLSLSTWPVKWGDSPTNTQACGEVIYRR